jgi:hypothetical protein
MNDIDFEFIEKLHSQCSMMDKASKISYLRGQWQQLNNLANQMAWYVQGKGGRMTIEERQYAQHLLEMINAVEEEEMKTRRELAGEGLKEMIRKMRGGS